MARDVTPRRMEAQMDLAKYNTPEYAQFSTAPEILAVIEANYQDSLLNIDINGAYGAWISPSPFEREAIIDWAFALTKDNALDWGYGIVERPAK